MKILISIVLCMIIKSSIPTKKIETRLVTDLSLHLIPELYGLRRMSQIDITYAQCIVGKVLSRYFLKVAYLILVSMSSSPKRVSYAVRVFSLDFHSARRREGVLLSTFSSRSSPNTEKIAFRIVAAILFLLLRHFVLI